MSESISLDDVRKYILDSNSLEEAERLLLDNLLGHGKNHERKVDILKPVNEATGGKYEVDKDKWVDKLKISDLFDERKKEKAIPLETSSNETLKSSPEISSMSAGQASSSSIPNGENISSFHNPILELKLRELHSKQMARSMSNQAYLLSAQRELDELKKNIEQRRSQLNPNNSIPVQKAAPLSMDSEANGDILNRLSEIGKKNNLSSINDMLDEFIESGSVGFTKAVSKDVIDQCSNL